MVRRRVLRMQIQALLDGLGPTRSDVAASLHEARVSGIPQDAANCAIAAYLTAVVGADDRVGWVIVRSTRVEARLKRSFGLRRRVVRVTLPKGARQFLSAFDHQMYPDLVRRAAPAAAIAGQQSTSPSAAELLGGHDPGCEIRWSLEEE
jgi:hypothetical protein